MVDSPKTRGKPDATAALDELTKLTLELRSQPIATRILNQRRRIREIKRLLRQEIEVLNRLIEEARQ